MPCLVVLAILFTGGVCSQCNVRQDPFAGDTTSRSLGATLYIDLNNPFTCYGIITQFRFCYKKLAGALSDNVYIGAYQPDADRDRYTRVGYNTIHINPLLKKDCLTVDANPQIVVNSGYVLAFYVTFAYFKLIEDPSHGYLYKSVAFPKSISTGVLIRTSRPYAPKLEAILSELDTLRKMTAILAPTL